MVLENAKDVKLVVIGDNLVGKTALLTTFLHGRFVEGDLPVVLDNCLHELDSEDHDGQQYLMNLWDSQCHKIYDNLRPHTYSSTNIFLICFAIDDVKSMENVSTKWVAEIRNTCPDIPYILVGTKADIGSGYTLDRNMGTNLALSIGAECYMECSAKFDENVQEVILEAARLAKRNQPLPPEKSGLCSIL